MKQKQLEIPNDEDNWFLTIGELLGKKVSVAVLASAIEKYGICTYDQYGRFVEADEKGIAYALDLLKDHHEWESEWESTPPQERSYERAQSPMYQWGCHSENAYGHFGWATKIAPDFLKIQRIQALGLEEDETELPTNTKPAGHLNHDQGLQQRANKVAAELKSSKKRWPTRNEVAKILADEVPISAETIERRICIFQTKVATDST